MHILAVDSSGLRGQVALLKDDAVRALGVTRAGQPLGSGLHGLIGQVARKSGVELNAVDLFAVAQGPGSFTGLRVGISAQKGFAWVARRPLVPVCSLLATACAAARPGRVVWVVNDAQRGEHFLACFRFGDATGSPPGHQVVLPPTLLRAGDTMEKMAEVVFDDAPEFVLTGTGISDEVRCAMPHAARLPTVDEVGDATEASRLKAVWVARLARARFESNGAPALGDVVPAYLRPMDAVLPNPPIPLGESRGRMG